MRRIFTLLFVFVLCIGLNQEVLAQRSKCGSQLIHNQKMQTDPAYKARYIGVERSIAEAYKEGKARANCVNPTFFPVAIHFDWTPSAADQAKLISLAQNQVATLNSMFNTSDCQGTTNSNCFEFKLATNNHPTGSGLTEGQPAVTFGGSAGVDYCATGGGMTQPCNLSGWTGYMNITVNDLLAAGNQCNDLGVSHLVGNPTTMNSMSVNSCAFGSIGIITGVAQALDGSNANQCDCLEGSINAGATVVHEIGHFLGLKHTFCADVPANGASGATPSASLPDGTGCQDPAVCSGGCVTTACDCDNVTDTPAQAYSNNGCPGGSTSGTVTNPSTGNAHAFSNFMDYVDDACMNCFSQGQYTRVAGTVTSAAAGVANYKAKSLVCPIATTPQQPIPTMSQWGLLIFGLLILNLGVVFIYRVQFAK